MKIVVIGGTGLIGRKVMQRLTEYGHDAVSASPSSGVNTVTGEGLDEAFAGAEVVVDVSNAPVLDDSALEFFTTSATNVLAAEATAGIRHHVALSVVGTDRIAPHSGYFAAKLAQEEMIAAGGTPYTIVRATQFFEFVATIADSATEGDTVRLPAATFQPMAAADVAEAVVIAAVNEPRNGIVEAGGPEKVGLDELIRTALAARGDRRTVVTDPDALYWGIPVDDTTLVPAAGAALFDTRFADWLLQTAATS